MPRLEARAATISTVAASATSVTIKAADNCLAVSILNNGTQNLFLSFGTTAATTTTACSVKLGPGAVWESGTTSDFVYSGAITGIWDVANGSAQVTVYRTS